MNMISLVNFYLNELIYLDGRLHLNVVTVNYSTAFRIGKKLSGLFFKLAYYLK